MLATTALPAPHGFTTGTRPGGTHGELAALRHGFGVPVVHQLRQVHGAVIRRFPHPGGETGDGAVLAEPNAAVAVKTADCVPVLLLAPRSGRVAVAHAGWRGTAAGVTEAAAAALAEASGEPPAALVAAIGPAIGPCCFEVGPEVPAAFREHRRPAPVAASSAENGKVHLDLVAANRDQLGALGVRRIHVVAACTRCGPGFHSYRRDGAGAGRNWSVIVNPGPAQATSWAARSA